VIDKRKRDERNDEESSGILNWIKEFFEFSWEKWRWRGSMRGSGFPSAQFIRKL
jgi:hypothetical protein